MTAKISRSNRVRPLPRRCTDCLGNELRLCLSAPSRRAHPGLPLDVGCGRVAGGCAGGWTCMTGIMSDERRL